MPFTDTFLARRDGQFEKDPFRESIGHGPNRVVCFASDADRAELWEATAPLVESLRARSWGTGYYGAGDFDIEPFVAGCDTAPQTAADVLGALRVRAFGSEHIPSLDVRELPFTGYQPYTANDEIHTDPSGQHLFYVPGLDEEFDEELEHDPETNADARRSFENHQWLREAIDGPVWYVLLHEEAGSHCSLVVLFAVGRGPGGHLCGVVGQQICHNLCD